MVLPVIKSRGELVSLINELGILPAFKCGVDGFSVEECIAPECWFSDAEGFWEWKGPVIREGGFAYGKLVSGKAAFIREDLYIHQCNYRRDGYDFDARYDDGLAKSRDKTVYDILLENKSMLSTELTSRLRGTDTAKRFGEIITRLQMQGYVVISDFEYKKDKYGNKYGWGVSRYELPEYRFGEAFAQNVYSATPDKSRDILLTHLSRLLKGADEKALNRIIGQDV